MSTITCYTYLCDDLLQIYSKFVAASSWRPTSKIKGTPGETGFILRQRLFSMPHGTIVQAIMEYS